MKLRIEGYNGFLLQSGLVLTIFKFVEFLSFVDSYVRKISFLKKGKFFLFLFWLNKEETMYNKIRFTRKINFLLRNNRFRLASFVKATEILCIPV